MTNVVAQDDPRALDVAAAALTAGEPIVVPTDTVYGLAARPDATDALFVLKGRPESVPIAVLVASLEQIEETVVVTDLARQLAHRFWPGPLTMVLHRSDGEGTVGIRCPGHEFVRLLARRCGPVAVTSANRHGEPTPPTVGEVLTVLAGPVAVAIDGGPCDGVASTVVDLTGDEVVFLRAGPISAGEIEAVALR